MGGEAAAPLLARAREHGVVTSADVLAPGEPGLLDWIGSALGELDYFLPNDDQVLALTGADDLEAGCRALLDRGVGCVAATCGADGALLVDEDGARQIPAFEVEAVDTTGCGDAFSAGFVVGLGHGRSAEAAARLGCAAAALVAGGLGSDHGEFDLAGADNFADSTPERH
jgi:sugar/nucleoside kinase (ribokinase family)